MLKYNRSGWAYFFVTPLVLVMLAVFLYPIIKVAMMSVQDWYMVRPANNGTFVGWDNYARMFGDRYFKNSAVVSVIYILVTVPARFLLGFVTALLLNQKFKGRAVARALVIIPWAVPEAVTCLVWILMYDKDFGIINSMLRNFGLISQNIGFLQNRGIALNAAMVVNVWKGFPFVAIMLLAGLQGIPHELYEASLVDGSNAWQRLRHITIPMLRPVSMIVFLLLVIWTIRDFGIVFLLARGGPSQATEVFTVYLYHSAFTKFDFGLASAGGMLMLAFALLFSFFYIRMINREERIL
jgi:multiple sugar transport system permease protein